MATITPELIEQTKDIRGRTVRTAQERNSPTGS